MLLPVDPTEPPFTDEDLEAYFEWEDENERLETGEPQGEEREPFPSPVVAWSVCDTGSAEYAMRMLAHAEAKLVELTTDAERFHEQIDRWLAGEAKRPRQASNFFEGQLEAYARRRREEDEKQKTLTVPSGVVTSHRNPARAAVAEDKPTKEAFIEWAKARGLPLVKAKWSPVMDEIKKSVVFRTVVFPKTGDHAQQVHDVDDHLLVLPTFVAEENVESQLEGLNVGVLIDPESGAFEERENVAIYRRDDGSWWLVPGVVLVPAEVTYTVKPSLP